MSLWKQCHIAGIPVTVASTASSIGGRGLGIGPYYVGSVYYRDGTTLRNRRLAWSPMLNLRDGTLAIWKVVQGWKSVASYLLRRYRESVVLSIPRAYPFWLLYGLVAESSHAGNGRRVQEALSG